MRHCGPWAPNAGHARRSAAPPRRPASAACGLTKFHSAPDVDADLLPGLPACVQPRPCPSARPQTSPQQPAARGGEMC